MASTVPFSDFSGTWKDFDEKIREVERQLTELKYQRNMRVPICRLPPEILGRILAFSIETGHFPPRKPIYSSSMCVCRHWHTVATSTPTLWSTPEFLWPERARMMIKYSKSVPLSIEWGVWYPNPHQRQLDVMCEALAQCSRISSLKMVFRSPRPLTTLLSKMVHPAPCVEFIQLNVLYNELQEFAIVPDDFLGREAPRLVALDVRGCSVPWGSPIFRNIRILLVDQSFGRAHNPPSLGDIAATLQACTMLEVLDMSIFLPSNASASIPRDTKIELPHLRRLRLSLGDMATVYLLHHMSFTSSTAIHLEIKQLDDVDDFLADYILRLFTNASATATHSRTIRALELDKSFDGYSLDIKVWETITMDSLLGHGDSLPRLHCELGSEGWNEPEAMSLLQKLLPALGTLAHLETLEVGVPGLSRDIMVSRFGKLPLLHSVFVNDDDCAPAIIESWSHDLQPTVSTPQGTATAGADGTVFPALKVVGISDIKSFAEILSPLIRSLKRRVEHRCPVRQIVLKRCRYLFKNDVASLKGEVGVDVVWDGQESGSETGDDPSSDDSS